MIVLVATRTVSAGVLFVATMCTVMRRMIDWERSQS